MIDPLPIGHADVHTFVPCAPIPRACTRQEIGPYFAASSKEPDGMPDKEQEPAPPAEDAPPWERIGTPRKLGRAGMVIDLRRCVGCHACSVSCKTEHDVALGVFRTRVHYLERPGREQLSFFPMLCMHCQEAPCIPACPTESISRLADGRVNIDQNTCKSSQDCLSACPYGAISLDPQTQLADKCDFCAQRTDVGLDPACVAACPSGTLRFGDLDDPEDAAMQYAERNNAHAFRADKGTKPSVLYVGLRAWHEQTLSGGIQLTPGEDELIYVQAREAAGEAPK